MNQEVIERILRYIEQHIEEKISLVELAELAGYSPFYFSKLFSEAMGMTVTGYIRVRKLQYAMVSLLEGEKVLDVAMRYAFESHEGFTRAFKRLFGSAPSTVRKYLKSYQVPEYVVSKSIKEDGVYMKNNQKENMHQLLFEVIRQSIQEAEEGYATEIRIELLPGGKVKVMDNGRGIPLTQNLEKDTILLDNILAGKPITSLEYSRMGDFSDIGLQTVNSLCESLQVNVWRDHVKYHQDYVRGVAQHEVKISETEHVHGMEIILQPDRAIFGEMKFEREIIDAWIKENNLRKNDLRMILD